MLSERVQSKDSNDRLSHWSGLIFTDIALHDFARDRFRKVLVVVAVGYFVQTRAISPSSSKIVNFLDFDTRTNERTLTWTHLNGELLCKRMNGIPISSEDFNNNIHSLICSLLCTNNLISSLCAALRYVSVVANSIWLAPHRALIC